MKAIPSSNSPRRTLERLSKRAALVTAKSCKTFLELIVDGLKGSLPRRRNQHASDELPILGS